MAEKHQKKGARDKRLARSQRLQRIPSELLQACPLERRRYRNARIVPNDSAVGERNHPGNVGRKCSTVLEIARVLARFDHVASWIVWLSVFIGWLGR